jgi:hypothetical protein
MCPKKIGMIWIWDIPSGFCLQDPGQGDDTQAGE